ncbi:MAG TPA: outer membrane beta-barrel protein [Lacibacter sp.]|nr:outer membrane beta-barrel protein [Lacibacter sp.]
MKKLFTSALALCFGMASMAQSDTTKPSGADTIKIGSIIIIKKNDGKTVETKENNKHDDDHDVEIEIKKRKNYKPSNISTNWWIVDLGFANVNDQTNYAAATAPGGYFPGGSKGQMDLRNGKSVNVNLWFFMQRINLIEHVVNLKYGLGLELNNYRYESNIRYQYEPGDFINTDAQVSRFDKNKLAADYVTVPVMLNFNFTPKKKKSYGLSAGVSAGYLYTARQKLISDERGKEKIKNDFNLEPWKLSAIGELNLGTVRFYGSYALNNMFRSGLDQTPYNIGIRFSSW